MKINLYVVGNIKEKYYQDAINEYLKRISRFADFKIIELKEEKILKDNEATIKNSLNKEQEKILSKINNKEFFIFDPNSKLFSSKDIANIIEKEKNTKGYINFVIGSSYGFSDIIKEKAKDAISLGRITLPHQLSRVVIVEQIYRAFKIIEGSKYDK